MIATRWLEEIVHGLDTGGRLERHAGLGVGACMYFCAVSALALVPVFLL